MARDDSVVPLAGLVSWWKMDDGVGDDKMGRNKAVGRNVIPVDDRHQRVGQAAGLYGRRSHFRVLQPSGVDFDLRSDSYTLSIWLRSSNPGRRSRLIQKWDELNTPYAFSLQTDYYGLDAVVYDRPVIHRLTVPDLWDGLWHHVAVVFDGLNGSFEVYRDGEKIEGLYNITIINSTQNNAPISIGASSDLAPGRYYSGSIDDIMVYNIPLSEGDIAILNNN